MGEPTDDGLYCGICGSLMEPDGMVAMHSADPPLCVECAVVIPDVVEAQVGSTPPGPPDVPRPQGVKYEVA